MVNRENKKGVKNVKNEHLEYLFEAIASNNGRITVVDEEGNFYTPTGDGLTYLHTVYSDEAFSMLLRYTDNPEVTNKTLGYSVHNSKRLPYTYLTPRDIGFKPSELKMVYIGEEIIKQFELFLGTVDLYTIVKKNGEIVPYYHTVDLQEGVFEKSDVTGLYKLKEEVYTDYQELIITVREYKAGWI